MGKCFSSLASEEDKFRIEDSPSDVDVTKDSFSFGKESLENSSLKRSGSTDDFGTPIGPGSAISAEVVSCSWRSENDASFESVDKDDCVGEADKDDDSDEDDSPPNVFRT
ncbi:hypothetical protein [Leptospira kmetyi]|uniref:hypothetical protein n=1 Tax=Leptospira kmetyi TaxID=408139 RepID=UPI003B837353